MAAKTGLGARNSFSGNIANIEKTIGYSFKDKSLLAQAFTRTSYCNEVNLRSGIKYQSNEVLEFFGDGVLSVAIISFLLKDCVERYEGGIRTQLREGDFSNIKSKLSDKKNLSKSTFALGLQKYLRMGEGDAKLGIENEPSVMEDLFESIIGAVYIDCGMDIATVMTVVEKMLDVSVYTQSAPPIQSAKNALQEWCQDKKRRLPFPTYKLLSKEGPDHKAVFEIGCYLGDRLLSCGKGKNEKIAGALAAEAALKLLVEEEEMLSGKAAPSLAEKKAEKDKNIKQQCKKKLIVEKRQIKSPVKKAVDIPAGAASCTRLREYAKSNKLLSPAFVDKGTSGQKGKETHSVECRFMTKSCTGSGKTREEAKENSARTMLLMLSSSKKINSAEGFAPRTKKVAKAKKER